MPHEVDVLKNSDCLAGMREIASGAVDLVFADPPFNIGYEYDSYDDRLDSEKYLDWCRQWTAEVVRILKPNGTFWLAIGDEYAAELKVMLQKEHGFSVVSFARAAMKAIWFSIPLAAAAPRWP
jgi:site-specific DNA-methyltransferase (adenine-specific)